MHLKKVWKSYLNRIFIILIFFFFTSLNFNSILRGAEEITIQIPCEVKECNPKWGPTITRLYKTGNNKPALIHFGGGPGAVLNLPYLSITFLQDKLDLIIMASPIAMKNVGYNGDTKNAYDKALSYRSKQVIDHYAKLLNKPLWLSGHSNGGPRMIGAIMGKDPEYSKKLAGLIFSSPNVGYGKHRKNPQYYIKVNAIKYELNLPILIINHARDLCPDTTVDNMKWLNKKFLKINIANTDLILMEDGYEGETDDCAGGHHMFASNKENYAKTIFDYILKNTK
jgi:hypothetical protein